MVTRRAVEPLKLALDGTGALTGSTGRYEKRLRDLAGLYRDGRAFDASLAASDGEIVYWVEDSRIEGPGELITGLSVLKPGCIGDEFYMTRGHLHAQPDRAELYLGVSGRGVMLLDSLDGDTRAIEINAGEAVQVPGYWVHRSVNVGDERFTTLFCYSADAGQDYEIIADAGGMRNLVVTEGAGWTTRPNPEHRGYRRG